MLIDFVITIELPSEMDTEEIGVSPEIEKKLDKTMSDLEEVIGKSEFELYDITWSFI
jgi:Ni,Fe-hydrogenase maturation factor